ncbi:nicotinate-nucleotide adenylyltransferase [Kangiella sp. TOML190]|uniref:nicotinate-nucleotide adenylyltransferase n=1 Tax=Kangiella sp. TOML190 TaxID=2931351 RepID=UPI00203E09A3|nr:nicotinate-nucleotide adenylyltransferase [Kangiella sp. TOML190]
MAKSDLHIILGGTFDPVHFGHLRMAQEMLNQFPQARISLLPAAYPPHRIEPAATPQQRIEMLQLVLEPIPELAIDSRELKREAPSYSVVTLEQIRTEIGADASLVFLMGTDAFAKLDSWYQWQQLLQLTNILVIGRPSSELPTQGAVADLYLASAVKDFKQISDFSHGKIGFYQMPQLDISSTYIRKQIKCGKSPRFLVPDVILSYIETHGLYRESQLQKPTERP